VKIDLLGLGQAIRAAEIQHLPGKTAALKITDIFGEDIGMHADLPVDQKAWLQNCRALRPAGEPGR